MIPNASEGEDVGVQKKAVKKVGKKVVKEGDVYKCSACGFVATADEVCGCVDACDTICCEKQMKPSKDTASSTTGRLEVSWSS